MTGVARVGLLFDRLYAVGGIRKALWRHWYPFLSWQLAPERVMFLNYAFETEPPMGLPLTSVDERDRGCIQLYHRAGTQVELRDKRVLEVSCGHGGGAVYLAKTRVPASYTAIDLNPRGISLCKKYHKTAGVSFLCADAEALPFPSGSFDVVLNVESSHCYADFSRFLAEVSRVLRPGGHFLYADFREISAITGWEQALAAAPLEQRSFLDISEDVLRGMEINSQRSGDIVRRLVPSRLRPLARDFAGMPGSRIHRALQDKTLSYRLGCFVRRN